MEDTKIINKNKKYEGKVFSVSEYDIHIENEIIKRDIIERKDGVVIVPMNILQLQIEKYMFLLLKIKKKIF